ncbi:MAG: hypothetical protein ABS81_00795 [Pseudonocardia sp. SCN 72-86]|nr:MAG: hypothetical protein ABS81_00795 [Pseudonocardia sp. SCN 72-86]
MTRPLHVPGDRVIDYDAFAQISIAEMRDRAEQWRSQGSVLWTDRNGGHWVVVSAAVAREVLGKPQLYSSAKPGQGVTLTKVERPLHVPLEMDPPEHRGYRALLIPLFAPKRIALLQDLAREIARERIEGFAHTGSCEIVGDFARPLASSMFMRLMDWPLEDRETLEAIVEQWLNGPMGVPPEERARLKIEAGRKADAYCREQVERRRAGQGATDDMTTALMGSTVEGEPIDPEMLVRLLKLLMIAGLDTVYSTLSQSMALLAASPKAQDYVRAHSDELPRIVEELLRWNAPAQVTRTAMVDAEFDGVRIAAGDTVHCLIAAINRDADEFGRPLELDFTRPTNRHLTFSAGPHKCIGSAMARMMLAVALEEFHAAVESYELESEESHLGGVWGMNAVRLTLKAPATVG